ncbi:MAG: putative S-layer protein [Nanoarchaeota archaeon]|nr:putative S-layer protein [Nanoarchaeota archaeon]
MIKNKTFCLSIASIFALVLVLNFASAATVFSDNFDDGDLTGWTTSNWSNAGTYAESTNVDNATLERTISTSGYETIIVKYDRQLGNGWETDNNFKLSWSVDGSTYTNLEEVVGVTADSPDLPNDASFVSKTFNLPSSANNNAGFRIKIECSTDATAEFCRLDNVVIEGTATSSTADFCAYDSGVTQNPGELKVDIRDITVIEGYGKDEEWLPLDEVEIEVRVENDGNYDVDDISLEWGIADSNLNNWVLEMDEIKEFNLKDGKDDTFIVTFQLREKDLDMDLDEIVGNNYKIVVRATGTIDDRDSSNDGEKSCHYDSEDVSIEEETDFVIINNIDFPETVQCGMDVQILADVWNIGSDEQDDVLVLLRNTELGIDERTEFSRIKEFDNEKLTFTVQIPEDASEKTYYLEFTVFDEDGDIYENDFDDEDSKFTAPLVVEGNCGVSQKALVSASLQSGGKAGDDLVIKTTITNTGTTSATYTLNAADYSSWASLSSIDPITLIVNSGESKEALLTFKVNNDASGDQTFNIEVLSGTDLVMKQPVSVSIEQSGFGGFSFGSNWYLWLIGALNVILVIIIIVIAVRVAK